MLSEENDGTDKRVDVEIARPWLDEETTRSFHSHDGHDDHEGDFVTVNEKRDLQTGLHQRHISLIALAGAIVR
jgi:amino acid permease